MNPDFWIVDTNVVVSALTSANPDSPTRRLLAGMVSGQMPFVISEELLSEYRRVLLRPKVRAATHLDGEGVDTLLQSLAGEAVIVDPVTLRYRAPDPGDDHLWALLEAFSGRAGLVTGDRLLLEQPPRDCLVLSPAVYFQRIGIEP